MNGEKQYKHPFECLLCSQHPKKDFTFFNIADDYLIAYPEIGAIHIHFGIPTHDDKDNLSETKMVDTFIRSTLALHPKIKFFVMVDFTRGDDSEFVPPEAMKMYRDIMKLDQIDHGVIYGSTPGITMLMKMLLMTSRHSNIKVVSKKKEADEEFERWRNHQNA